MNPRHQRSPRNLTINKIFPDFLTDGVITAIQNPPWSDSVNQLGLNIAYHSRSGDKFIAPILYNYVDKERLEISQVGKDAISVALNSLYSQKWSRLWSIYNTEYNPLYNHNLTETRSLESESGDEGTVTRTPNLQEMSSSNLSNYDTFSQTDNRTSLDDRLQRSTRTPNITISDSGSETVTTDESSQTATTYGKTNSVVTDSDNEQNSSIYGFNSQDPSNANKQTESINSTVTGTAGGVDTVNINHDNSVTTERDMEKTETGTESLSINDSGTVTEKNNTDFNRSNKQNTVNTFSSTGTESTESNNTNTVSLTETISRIGNVQNPAELLDLARTFWLTEYFEIVFSDIDKFLTLSVYSSNQINHYYGG